MKKQYIDKTVVKAEIIKRLKYNGTRAELDRSAFMAGKEKEDEYILTFLDTLETKENDLVEELDYDDYMTFFKEHPEYNNGDWGFEETWTFGQYCYKLGLKAQKVE